ncbi:uncharacterized protein EV422DRAFT_524707 [Fimicolochytrium jonesii]|uniref:uncharacterized protein n=1 Tax=Fimicolochytrium jonesii TaxID=1396493 RepID=UPI0022FED337|nr:uncharacterized protein EV422DRAFT_524707 [Fimicolochytrium jonesii]KAI8822610.1 hypothetical protein EV422DRAFT_524707 [Fimicolochytrium jonesii]
MLAYNPEIRINSREALRYAYFKDVAATAGGSDVDLTRSGRSASTRFKSGKKKHPSLPQIPGVGAAIVAGAAVQKEKDKENVPHQQHAKAEHSTKKAETETTKEAHGSSTYIKPTKVLVQIPEPTVPTIVASSKPSDAAALRKSAKKSHPQQIPPQPAPAAAAPVAAPTQQQQQRLARDHAAAPAHVANNVDASAPSGTLMAVAQHVPGRVPVPQPQPQSQKQQQQPPLRQPQQIPSSHQQQQAPSTNATLNLPPIAPRASDTTNPSLVPTQVNFTAALTAAAAAHGSTGSSPFYAKFRARGDDKKGSQQHLATQKTNWGSAVVGKNAITGPQGSKLPSIHVESTSTSKSIPSYQSHQAPTTLPSLTQHTSKQQYNTTDHKTRTKESLTLPSLLIAKQPHTVSIASTVGVGHLPVINPGAGGNAAGGKGIPKDKGYSGCDATPQ